MPLLTPQYDFHRIEEIPTDFFIRHGIRALLLDVDNTLTGDNSQEIKPEVMDWLERQRAAGLRLFVISNNHELRVAPFANRLGLGYIAGDQLFTDILCGNLCGCVTILVEPYAEEGYGLYRIKRPLEKPLLRLYHRRKRRNAE